MKKIPLFFMILIIVNSNLSFADDSACSYFYPKLFELPHIKLTQNSSGFKSLLNGDWTHGCEIVFESHDSIVSGDKVYDTFQSFINAPGWTINNNLSSDGPGSSSIGIENERNKCTILWSQHAWLDEQSNEIKQSRNIEMMIQCTER